MKKSNISANEIVKQLNELREVVDVFIPSQGKSFKFKVLTAIQQKNLLRTLIGDSALNNNFYSEFNKIIVENSISENLLPDHINVHDRNSIAIQLRIASLGSIYETQNEEDKTIKIDLNKIQNVEKTFPDIIVEENGIKISLGIPNILDNEMFGTCMKYPNREEILDNKNTDVIANYAIDATYLKISEHIVSIEFSSNKFFDAREDGNVTLNIVQNLPSSIFRKIYEKVQKEYIDPVNEFLTIDDISLEIKSIFAIV